MVDSLGTPPPVLLLVFNRPEQTQMAINAILRERPSRIYVSGDGPRRHVPTDQQGVERVWDLIHATPWDCELIERRIDSNVGCGSAVRSALDWFFDQEAYGFIVEDDVELAPGALALATHLFDVGARDPHVGNITVFNTVPERHLSHPQASYRRSLFSASQGWGTWAKTWQACPQTPEHWRSWLPESALTQLGGVELMRRWSGILDRDVLAHQHPTDFTWDFTWQAHLWATQPISLVSNVNLIRNTGFSSDATFSTDVPKWWPMESGTWSEPFIAPPTSDRDTRADRWEGRSRYAISRWYSIRRSLAERLPGLTARYRKFRFED